MNRIDSLIKKLLGFDGFRSVRDFRSRIALSDRRRAAESLLREDSRLLAAQSCVVSARLVRILGFRFRVGCNMLTALQINFRSRRIIPFLTNHLKHNSITIKDYHTV